MSGAGTRSVDGAGAAGAGFDRCWERVAMEPVPVEPTPARLPGVVVRGPSGWPAVVEWFLAGKKGNTASSYRTDLRQFTEWLAGEGVDPLEANRAVVNAYKAHLEDDLVRSPATVSRKLSAIAGAYETAVAEDVIARSPVRHIERPRIDESQGLGLDRQQLLDVVGAAVADSPLARALVVLLALNGLRVSEACGADVAGLSRVRGHRVLAIRRKRGKDREIALDEMTQAAVDAYLAGRRTGPLLQAPDGPGRLSRHAAARVVARCGRDAGIPDPITPHVLRRSYVTLCLDAGIPLHEVQDSADHADPKTTQRYNTQRHRLDEAPTYRLVDYLTGRIGPGGADPQGRLFD